MERKDNKSKEEIMGTEEPQYFEFSASLRIFGENIDIESITKELNVFPSHTHKKGDNRNIKSKTEYENDMWMFTAPVERNEVIGKHIDFLWNSFKNKIEYLKILKTRCTVDVFLGYRSNCDTAGVEIPFDCLKIFIALEIPIGISIIIA